MPTIGIRKNKTIGDKFNALYDNLPDDLKHVIITFLQPIIELPSTKINISYFRISNLVENYKLKYWSQKLKNLPKTLAYFNILYEFALQSGQMMGEKTNNDITSIFRGVRFANLAIYDKMDNFRDDCDYNLILCIHYNKHNRTASHMKYHYQRDARECHCKMRNRILKDIVSKINQPTLPFILSQQQSLMDSTREILADIIHIAIYEYYKFYNIYKDQNNTRVEWLCDNERKILRIMLFLIDK